MRIKLNKILVVASVFFPNLDNKDKIRSLNLY